MHVEPAVLVARMAVVLRDEIGPAVGEEFSRTQAFMASVILAKLASELAAAEADGHAAADEHVAAAGAVGDVLGGAPPSVAAALDALTADGAPARWSAVVQALYDARDDIERATFERALRVLREALRARLDRALVHAR